MDMDVMEKVSKTLSRNYGITVSFRGSKAYTDGKRIIVPSLPDNIDAETLAKVRGYCDHEVGHVRFTNWTVVKSITNPELHRMANLLEDFRIERLMGNEYEGCRKNLERLASMLADPLDDEAHIMSKLWVQGRREVCGYKLDGIDGTADVEFAFGKGIMARIKAMRSTADALALAKDMLAHYHSRHDEEIDVDGMPESKMDKKSRKPSDKDEQAEGDDHGEDASGGDDGEAAPGEGDAAPEPGDGDADPEGDNRGTGESSGGGDDDSDSDDGGGSDGADTGDSEDGEPDPEDGDGGSGDSEVDDSEPSADSLGDAGDGESDDAGEDGAGDEGDGDAGDEGAGDAGGEGGGEDEGDDEGDDEGEGAGDAGGEDEGEGSHGEAGDGEEVDGEAGDGEDEDSGPSGDGAPGDEGHSGDDGPFERTDRDDKIEEWDDDYSKVVKDLEKFATDTRISDGTYLVMTKEYDILEPFPKKDYDGYLKLKEKLGPLNSIKQKVASMFLAKTASKWYGGKEEGKLDARTLASVRAGNTKVFKQKVISRERDTAVTFLVDWSGSMYFGGKIEKAMMATVMFIEALGGTSVKSEVLTYTTADLPSAVARKISSDGRGVEWGRVEALVTYILKGFDEPLNRAVKERIGAWRYAPLKENCDGDNVKIAWQRLKARNEKRKILFVLSDGSVANQGSWQHGEAYLKRVCDTIIKDGEVELIGIGLMSDSVNDYYPKTIIVNSAEGLAKTMLEELRKILGV